MHNSGPEAIHLFVLWQIPSVYSIENLQLIILKFHDFSLDDEKKTGEDSDSKSLLMFKKDLC